jgi:hypothetical protein
LRCYSPDGPSLAFEERSRKGPSIGEKPMDVVAITAILTGMGAFLKVVNASVDLWRKLKPKAPLNQLLHLGRR